MEKGRRLFLGRIRSVCKVFSRGFSLRRKGWLGLDVIYEQRDERWKDEEDLSSLEAQRQPFNREHTGSYRRGRPEKQRR